MTDRNAEDQGHTYATNQTEIVEEGMQGATGSMDANGLSGEAGEDKLEELRENLSGLTDEQEQRIADEARGE